jgi:hypothetical protein
MTLLRAFTADMALMFREFGQCIASGLRDFAHDIGAAFR